MKIGHIELFVRDPKKASNFYIKKLGFSLESDQGEYVWVKLDNIELLLRPGKAISSQSYENTSIALVLYTNDLKKSEKELMERGIEFAGFDQSKNCLTFKDLDGHWWQLVNPNH